MSLQLHPIGPIPEETERVARSAFPKSNIYLRLRDELGAIYDDGLHLKSVWRLSWSLSTKSRADSLVGG
jgi:hypothetical protein